MGGTTTAAGLGTLARSAAPAGLKLPVALWTGLCLLLLLPLLRVDIPQLVDYPNHLARLWIIMHRGSIPELAANYLVHWRVLPDLAIDLVVTALAIVLPVVLAGKVFVALTMLSLVGGTAMLHRALYGRVGLWPLCSLLFVYNAVLFWGFLNCLFGVGVALFAFSFWILSRTWTPLLRLPVFALLGSVLLLLHLFAFCLYGLAVVTYELALRLEQRPLGFLVLMSWCRDGLQFIPGMLLWGLSLRHAGPTYTAYGSLADKLYGLVAPVTFGYRPELIDRVFFICIAGFLVWALAGRRFRLASRMKLPLLAMLIAAAAMPNWTSGSWAADLRLPVTLAFVGIASTELHLPNRRAATVLAATVFLLLGLRAWSVDQHWTDYAAKLTEFRQADALIAPGARLLVAEVPGSAQKGMAPELSAAKNANQFVSFLHLPAFAVIDRAAFEPYLFTGWTTLEVASRNADFAQSYRGGPLKPATLLAAVQGRSDPGFAQRPGEPAYNRYWHDWPKDFDYLLWIDVDRTFEPTLPRISPIFKGSYFTLFKIERP